MDTDFEVSMNSPSSSLREQGASLNKNISNILSMLDSPAAATEEEEGMQDTQSLNFLKDVVAYVEVRTGTENRSKAICRELLLMGATVVPKFSNEVTHVIFKDGKKSTCDKAVKKGAHLVSVLWVDSCKQNQDRVCESMFPGNKPQTKGTPIMVARLKKAKSMQPKDFDEEVASSAERNVKNRKRMATKAKYRVITTPGDEDGLTPTRRPMFVVENTCPRSPDESLSLCHSITIPATPPSMREKLNDLRTRKSIGISDIVSDSDSDEEEPIKETPYITDGDALPLQRRLFGNDEDSLASVQSSPLFLSGGSSNNSTIATSPYVKKLLKQKQGRKSNTASPVHGSPCNEGSSFPPGYDDKCKKIVSTNIKSVDRDPDSSMGTRVIKSSLPTEKTLNSETDDNIDHSFSDTAEKQHDQYSLLESKTNKLVRTKSCGRKKKLLSTNYDFKPSSQLISPARDSDNETSENESPIKKTKRTKRKKVTAKKNKNRISKDPNVLFTGKEITGKVNETFKKKNKRKISDLAHEEQEITGTPNKKVKTGENYLNNKENTKKRNDIDHTVKFKTNFVNSKSKQEETVKGQGKSILKGKTNRTKAELIESQPHALNIDTPVSFKKSANFDNSSQTNKSVSKSGINTTSEVRITSKSRKSVNFSQSLKENSFGEVLNKQKTSRGRRQSVGACLDSDIKTNKSKEKTKRRKSIATSQVSNQVDGERSSHNKRPLSRSSVTNKRAIESEEISPEIAIQSSKRSVGLQQQTSRRRSVRLSNINNSTLCTQITQDTRYEDSLTDVTALSTQNITLTPSGRTKNLLSALAKSNNTVNNTKFKHCEKQLISKLYVNDTVNKSIDDNSLNDSLDKSTENIRNDNANYGEALISKCESMVIDKDVSADASKNSILSLTNSRKSIDEFSTGHVKTKSKGVKGRSTSFPLSRVTHSGTKSTKTKIEGMKRSVLKDSVKVHNTQNKSYQSDKMFPSKCDKRKWKNVDVLSDVDQKPMRNLVMTSLHFDEQDVVHSVVQKLGGFSIQDAVNKQTTHVVCGEGQRRTLNVLYCIAQGGWLLSLEWVFKSLEAGEWLDEMEYEMFECFPSCKISREEKDLDGRSYCPNLFSNEGLLYVADASKPPKKDLVKLIKLCGGKISSTSRQADVCIGSMMKAEKLCLSEQWILDSITQMKTLPYESYKLNSYTKCEREPSPDY